MSHSSENASWRPLSMATAGSAVPVVVGLLLIQHIWTGVVPVRYLAGVAGGMIVVIALLWWVMPSVDAARSATPPIHLASWITISRGSALALLGGFLLAEPPGGVASWMPAVFFSVAAMLDGVDGWVARNSGMVSSRGARLDEAMDTATLLFGAILVVVLGLAHWSFLVAGLAKFAFQGGLVLRVRFNRPVWPLDERRLRKALAAAVMAAIFIALLPSTGRTEGWLVTSVALAPFLLHFIRDWLVVSGRW